MSALKQCRFLQSETTDSFSRLYFPRDFEVFFRWWPVIYRVFFLKRCAELFSLSHRHAVLQWATSDLQKAFQELKCHTIFTVLSCPFIFDDRTIHWENLTVSDRGSKQLVRLKKAPHIVDVNVDTLVDLAKISRTSASCVASTIVDLPINSMVIFYSYVSLPESITSFIDGIILWTVPGTSWLVDDMVKTC